MTQREVILFDLGGVLFCDPWETLLLTPVHGIAARMGIAAAEAEQVGLELWGHYSIQPSREEQYWTDLGDALGHAIPAPLVREVEYRLLLPSPWARQLIAKGRSTGATLGVASNNTSFWYAKQASMLGISKWADTNLVFVSQELGVTKSSPGRGMYEVIAEHIPPEFLTVVEDRNENMTRAAQLGIETIHYNYHHDAGALPNFRCVTGSAR